MALVGPWLTTTAAAVEMTINVNAPNNIPIHFNARLSAIANPSLHCDEKTRRRPKGFAAFPQFLQFFPIYSRTSLDGRFADRTRAAARAERDDCAIARVICFTEFTVC